VKKGYYQLTVKPVKELLEDGSMKLTMHVHEGEVTHIRQIRFIGNQAFSDAELADKVSASISGLIPWFSNKDVIDTKKFANDAQILVEFYQSFYLTFALHEGPIYHVEEGQIYAVSDLRATIEAKRNIEDQTVGIVFDVEKGREVYIERIEIEGNERTDDGVIRREIKLPLFKDVRVAMPRGSADDRVNTKVTVEEDQTGSFIVGAGFSQVEKVLFRVKTSEKNLLGKGYAASVTADVGKVTQNFDVSLTDPYFMDTNVAATLTLNKTQTNLNNATATANLYTQNDFGGGVNFSVPISEHVYYGVGYNYTNSNLSNIDPTASFLLKSQAGKQTTSLVSQSLSYDTRDRFISTTKGYQDSVDFSFAGLGGVNRFWEAGASVKGYLPVIDDFVLSGSLAGRVIQSYSGVDVPIYRRYSLGGIGSVRGFDFYGISLRDPATGDPVGGNKQVTGALNFYFPLPYVQTSGFRGVTFMDMGTVWGKENLTQVSAKFSLSSMRVSAGFGIEWISPVGPVTLSWAKPLRKQPGDVLRGFEFGLGRAF